MMQRENWLAKAGGEDERRLFARIWEAALKAAEEYRAAHDFFLSVHDQASLRRAWPSLGRGAGLKLYFWGGFADAERRLPVILPDFYEAEAGREAGLADWDEAWGEDPLAYLRLRFKREDGPSHRDVLGAVLGLGLDRGRLGDLCFHEDGCDLVILPEAGPLILQEMDRAGRHPVSPEKLYSRNELRARSPELREVRLSLASLRLDNAVAGLWNLPRDKAQGLLAEGRVSLDGLRQTKPAAEIKPGQIIRCRGLGKAVFEGEAGLSRKGRILSLFSLFV